MKVALVHDYIKEYGGAERVLETLHEMYPDAPVFTAVYCPEFLGPHKDRFTNWDIHPSLLQKIPFKHKLISPFRLLVPFVFPMFDLSGYDVVIVSATGAYSPNTINKRKAKQICYYHTPPRYLYGLATAREWKKNPLIKFIGNLAFSWLRKIDVASSKQVDIAIANSQNVAERIKKFYHKDAVVVYPPVNAPVVSSQKLVASKETTNYKLQTTNYYLAGGRLARPKHVDLIIKACQELGVPLKVFGKGFAGYGEELQSLVYHHSVEEYSDDTRIKEGVDSGQARMTGKIEFLGEVTDEEKTSLLAGAKAYIFAAEDEDFGMLPVEAMGVGRPVIAYKSGGPKESIIDGKTGIFFDELTVKSVTNAMKKFETLSFNTAVCKKQAEKFSKNEFIKKIQIVISSAVEIS